MIFLREILKNKNKKKLFYGDTPTSLYFALFLPKEIEKQQYDQETIQNGQITCFLDHFW